MKPKTRISPGLALVVAVLVLTSGCATVAGTAVSPITGGVDLTRYHVDEGGSRLWVPFVFVGGAVAGPFAALWNGIGYEASQWPEGWSPYWRGFGEVFSPFEMIDRNGAD